VVKKYRLCLREVLTALSIMGVYQSGCLADIVLPTPPAADAAKAAAVAPGTPPPPPAIPAVPIVAASAPVPAPSTLPAPAAKPADNPAPTPPPAVAPTPPPALPTAAASAPTPAPAEHKDDATVAKPLAGGAAAAPHQTDAVKDMVTKADTMLSDAQSALHAIQDEKDKRLSAYVTFDESIDDVYTQSGVARGEAAAEIKKAKDYILAHMSAEKDTNKPVNGLVTKAGGTLDSLSKELQTLRENDSAVISAVTKLSDAVSALADSLVQLESDHDDLASVADEASAKALFDKVSSASTHIVGQKTAITIDGGAAKRVDDAIAKANDQIMAVKKILDTLKGQNVDLSKIIKDAMGGSGTAVSTSVASSGSAEASTAASAPSDEKKKSRVATRAHESTLQSVVRGTFFEAPYNAMAWVLGGVAYVCSPLHTVYVGLSDWFSYVWNTTSEEKILETKDTKQSADPVLERIRIERNEAARQVEELKAQRQTIEMKEALLDRLEAERFMHLDTQEDIKKHIDSAYLRKDKELSWYELFKRVVWKSYASVKRVVIKTRTWLWGDAA